MRNFDFVEQGGESVGLLASCGEKFGLFDAFDGFAVGVVVFLLNGFVGELHVDGVDVGGVVDLALRAEIEPEAAGAVSGFGFCPGRVDIVSPKEDFDEQRVVYMVPCILLFLFGSGDVASNETQRCRAPGVALLMLLGMGDELLVVFEGALLFEEFFENNEGVVAALGLPIEFCAFFLQLAVVLEMMQSGFDPFECADGLFFFFVAFGKF